jgi:hypothetical protein
MVIFPFDAVGSVAESFDTVMVEQERHTFTLLVIIPILYPWRLRRPFLEQVVSTL